MQCELGLPVLELCLISREIDLSSIASLQEELSLQLVSAYSHQESPVWPGLATYADAVADVLMVMVVPTTPMASNIANDVTRNALLFVSIINEVTLDKLFISCYSVF